MEEVAQQESEMEWIHRIDVHYNGEGDVPATPVSGLSFRASEQSKVNAYGGGSSCGGGNGWGGLESNATGLCTVQICKGGKDK